MLLYASMYVIYIYIYIYHIHTYIYINPISLAIRIHQDPNFFPGALRPPKVLPSSSWKRPWPRSAPRAQRPSRPGRSAEAINIWPKSVL